MVFVLTPHAAGSQIAQTLLGGTLPSWCQQHDPVALKAPFPCGVWGLCFGVQTCLK